MIRLLRTAEIGAEEGLHYVYAGNAPGRVGRWENTYCPTCRELLIDRIGYLVRDYKLTHDGKCPKCRTAIPGLWPPGGAAEVRTGNSMVEFYRRVPRRVPLS